MDKKELSYQLVDSSNYLADSRRNVTFDISLPPPSPPPHHKIDAVG